MKLFKYFLLLFIIYLINILPVQAYQNDYLIEKYDLNIIVNENNTFDITENITAYFNIPKHGIIRNIPIKNEIRRLDGSTSSNITELSNLNINDKYSLSRSGGYYKIQIGSQNKTITGAKNYTIKYNYNLGKDPLKDKDELYFNIIGNEWDTKISNITFKITMPKDFDKSKLGFSSGAYGSTSSKNIEYEVKDNVITGKYIGTLNAREGITIRCELPEGYFVNAGFPIRFIDLLFIIFPMLSLLIALLLWFKYGKDEKYQKKLTPYPPKDINSLELGYIYKGNVTEASIASLLIYLANKGYLKIEPIEEKSLFKTTYNLKIIKQKEYTDTNLNEKLFLNDLFLDRTHPNNENNPKYNNEIISLCIDDSYYDISKNLDNQKTKFFEKTKTKMLTILIFMIIISYLFITIPPIVRFGEIDSIGLSFIIPFGIFFALLPFIDTYNRKKVLKKGRLKEERSKGLIIVFPIFLIFFAIVPFCFSVMPAILTNSFYFLTIL